jgi:hypothetical protein
MALHQQHQQMHALQHHPHPHSQPHTHFQPQGQYHSQVPLTYEKSSLIASDPSGVAAPPLPLVSATSALSSAPTNSGASAAGVGAGAGASDSTAGRGTGTGTGTGLSVRPRPLFHGTTLQTIHSTPVSPTASPQEQQFNFMSNDTTNYKTNCTPIFPNAPTTTATSGTTLASAASVAPVPAPAGFAPEVSASTTNMFDLFNNSSVDSDWNASNNKNPSDDVPLVSAFTDFLSPDPVASDVAGTAVTASSAAPAAASALAVPAESSAAIGSMQTNLPPSPFPELTFADS